MEISVQVVKANGESHAVNKTVDDDWYQDKRKPIEYGVSQDSLDSKADKTELQAIWDEMAEAYTNGVNSI